MTGLDKILEQIKKESDETVSKKLSEAKDRADSILEEAKKDISGRCESIETNGSNEAQEIRKRAGSAADLYKRKAVLAELYPVCLKRHYPSFPVFPAVSITMP